jgi:amino acid transporter
VAAYDGASWGWFGVFNRRLGTPVRVNIMSGVVATAFCVVALAFFNDGADSTFGVVLDIALSTTLISYILVFPAILKLRYSHADVHRPYRFPFGTAGIWAGTILVTFFILLGSWAAVFPGTLEPLIGVDYGSFTDAWGVSRLKFEAYALGTLGEIVLLGVAGYVAGAPTRRAAATAPID